MAEAARRLAAAGVPDAARDARRLMAHALDIAPDRLTLALAEPLPAEAAARYERAVARRIAREPVSHIVGRRAFWGRDFAVTPDVLDPRPETETLVALALEAPFADVLDLGTGSGCLLLSLLAERPAARGLGTDVSAPALEVARRNARALGVAERAELRLSDWFASVEGDFDLIVANPPYIAAAEMADLAPELAREPALALTPGGDGLGAYREIAAGASAHLRPEGRLMVEIGPTQAAEVASLFVGAEMSEVAVHRDLDGRERVVSARKPPRVGPKGA